MATRHRVRQTRAAYRTSIAFFYEPNFDAVIRPLDVKKGSCKLVASTPALARGLQGEELIYGEHLFAKVSSNFDFRSLRQELRKRAREVSAVPYKVVWGVGVRKSMTVGGCTNTITPSLGSVVRCLLPSSLAVL